MTEQHPPQRFQPRIVNFKASKPVPVSKPVRVSKRELAELFAMDFTKDADSPADTPSSSDLPPGAFSLSKQETYLVSKHLEGVKNGEEVDFRASGKGAKLGRTVSGEPYLTTPASVARAEGEAWARAHDVGQRRI